MQERKQRRKEGEVEELNMETRRDFRASLLRLSLDQQHMHHLGACQKCGLLSPTKEESAFYLA